MSALADGDCWPRPAGDQDAFTERFTRSEGRVFGHLFRMVGDRAGAEDLTRGAFIRAHIWKGEK